MKSEDVNNLRSNKNIPGLKFYTIATKYSNCFDYLVKLTCLENKDHYNQWCEIHNLNNNDELSSLEYVKAVGLSKNYSILKVFYSLEDIAIWLRLVNSCIPIGCSYESPIERKV